MSSQWPPAPTNGKRVESIGRLRLEFGGDTLYATQPSHLKRRRYMGNFVFAAEMVEIAAFGGLIASTRFFPGGFSWWSVIIALGPLLFLMPAAYFGALWIVGRFLHTGSFCLERTPRLFRAGAGRSYALPETAALAVEAGRYGVRRIYVVWLTIPNEDGRGVRRFGLASFKTSEIAEQARREMEMFLG